MINTVTGAVKKEELGLTLGHEHLAWDGGEDIEQLYFDKQYNADKVERLYKALLPLFARLKELGCGAVAEASPPEGGQNLKLMYELSKASGVKLIPNTGMIFSKNVYRVHKELYETELAEQWIKDYAEGLDTIDGTLIRPAQIKLFMSRGKLPEGDIKILKAAVIASKATGLPIHCHIMEAVTAEEVMEVLEKEKLEPSKFLWAHAGLEGNLRVIEKAAAKGFWLGYDVIRRGSHGKYVPLLKEAISDGYADRILLSQDYDFYEEISNGYDSNPCASLLEEFLPYCESSGISRQAVIQLLTKNPAEYLDIK